MRNILTFNRIPKLMTTHAMLNIGKMLNYFPTKAGVSTIMIPRAILNGENLDYERHLPFQDGKYCQVHENETPHRIDKYWTQSAICIGPSGNQKGGY